MDSILLQCPQCERTAVKTNVNGAFRFFCKNCKIFMEPVPYGFEWPVEVWDKMMTQSHNKNRETINKLMEIFKEEDNQK